MTGDPRPYAVMAEFADADALRRAAADLAPRRLGRIEAFSPFPVEGLAARLGTRDRKVPAATLIGGIVGAVCGFAMQAATNLDYPLWIGGRPLVAVPAFMLITFELAVLGAVLAGIGTMLIANRLPRFHHPLFEVEAFRRASDDRFFLAVLPGADFDRDAVGKALAALDPEAIYDVPAEPAA